MQNGSRELLSPILQGLNRRPHVAIVLVCLCVHVYVKEKTTTTKKIPRKVKCTCVRVASVIVHNGLVGGMFVRECVYARARAYLPFVRVLNQYLNSACRLNWVSQFDGILLFALFSFSSRTC